MNVREATVEDVGRIVDMGMRFLETDYKGLVEPDANALVGVVLLLINTGVIFVAERDHANDCATWGSAWPTPADVAARGCNCGPRIVGFLALAVLEHPMTGRPYGDEVGWWVDPEWRKGTAGPRMLWCAEEYTRQKGLSVLKMVAPAGSPSVAAFYERRGYVAVETAYQKSFEGS